MAEVLHHQSPREPKSLILCFDGTGNKFQGTQADSNIVKIYNLLDRQDHNQFHYYQPGIGTYVETSSLSHKSRFGRIKSAYIKAKDQAIGTSFGEHVMAGYKFLMRYYSDGDKIYFFGFSRGAYTARFLAQMLDYVGLLSAGNEEMLRFAWKTFAQWQMRTDETASEKQKRTESFEFMKKFRETFSRPIVRIEFIGLFDCVNSVPQFESAWMTRTKFPYTAKTSAKVIRHAVSIDERRAKFRQDLLSEQRKGQGTGHHHHHHHHHLHHQHEQAAEQNSSEKKSALPKRPSLLSGVSEARFRPKHRSPPQQTLRQVPEIVPSSAASQMSVSQVSINSATAIEERVHDDPHSGPNDEDSQDILEVWFMGQHGDIGGGWTLSPGEERPLSDIPLMWMLQEARRAGMPFDEAKLEVSNFIAPRVSEAAVQAPSIRVEGQPLSDGPVDVTASQRFAEDYHKIATTSRVHDSLKFGGGLSWSAVLAWSFMENLPFRRMDLQPDGSWRPISWPLPCGETRDMPSECIIHHSVIRRMQADPTYRPGNLIVGGGGRGVRFAKEQDYEKVGWKTIRDHGDLVGEARIKHELEEIAKANGLQ